MNDLTHPAGLCTVWSGSNFVTFDGQFFTFDENCTYYLVKEIISKYNLTIIRRPDCDPSESIFCPLAMTITYQSTEVVLTQTETSGTPTIAVSSHFKKHDFILTYYISLKHTDKNCLLSLFHRFM